MQSNNYVVMPMYKSAGRTEYTFECRLTEDVSNWGGQITIHKGSLPSRLFKTVNVVISKQDIVSSANKIILWVAGVVIFSQVVPAMPKIIEAIGKLVG